MLAEIMLEYAHSIFFGREEFAAIYGSSVLFDELKNVVDAKGKRLEGILRDYCLSVSSRPRVPNYTIGWDRGEE